MLVLSAETATFDCAGDTYSLAQQAYIVSLPSAPQCKEHPGGLWCAVATLEARCSMS